MSQPALAHPHILIDATLTVGFDAQGRIASLRNSWTFDSAFSVWMVQGLDTDGDGTVSSAEMQELAEAAPDDVEEEAGDLLFAAVNLVRAYGVDAEAALRRANDKFERRYRAMERMAAGSFGTLDLEQQEALWQAVKAEERAGQR